MVGRKRTRSKTFMTTQFATSLSCHDSATMSQLQCSAVETVVAIVVPTASISPLCPIAETTIPVRTAEPPCHPTTKVVQQSTPPCCRISPQLKQQFHLMAPWPEPTCIHMASQLNPLVTTILALPPILALLWNNCINSLLCHSRLTYAPAHTSNETLVCKMMDELIGRQFERSQVRGSMCTIGCQCGHMVETLEELQKFLKATSLLDQQLEKLLEEHQPNCLMADNCFPWTTDLAAKFGIPRLAWHIGPTFLCNKDTYAHLDEHECLKWLNSKTPNSVVYVSFGSVIKFDDAQLLEIALGLEASGQQFIWVVKKEKSDEENKEDWLPEGFEKRVKGRGLVIRGWAPQVPILEHQAVEGFVTHCGWNSVIEAVSAGMPQLFLISFIMKSW
ncbi:unnamed protein product [Prunus armeniaca]